MFQFLFQPSIAYVNVPYLETETLGKVRGRGWDLEGFMQELSQGPCSKRPGRGMMQMTRELRKYHPKALWYHLTLGKLISGMSGAPH